MPDESVEPGVLFFTAASEPYHQYVAPYIASVLHFNPTASVEVVVDDWESFGRRHKHALRLLHRRYKGRYTIWQSDLFLEHQPGVVRFLQQPRWRRQYLYIGDIDILVLDEVAAGHIARMREAGMRYSNIIRRNKLPDGLPRLTGLHFTEFDAFYPIVVPPDLDVTAKDWGFDELLLHRMVQARGIEISASYDYRPLHGFHLSMKGFPLTSWGVKIRAYHQAWDELRRSELWQALIPYFDPRYRILLSLVDVGLEAFRTCGLESMRPVRALSG